MSLAAHARAADALGLAELLYGVLGLALLGRHRLGQSQRRRGRGVVAVPSPRVGFALIILGLLLQALAEAIIACR